MPGKCFFCNCSNLWCQFENVQGVHNLFQNSSQEKSQDHLCGGLRNWNILKTETKLHHWHKGLTAHVSSAIEHGTYRKRKQKSPNQNSSNVTLSAPSEKTDNTADTCALLPSFKTDTEAGRSALVNLFLYKGYFTQQLILFKKYDLCFHLTRYPLPQLTQCEEPMLVTAHLTKGVLSLHYMHDAPVMPSFSPDTKDYNTTEYAQLTMGLF